LRFSEIGIVLVLIYFKFASGTLTLLGLEYSAEHIHYFTPKRKSNPVIDLLSSSGRRYYLLLDIEGYTYIYITISMIFLQVVPFSIFIHHCINTLQRALKSESPCKLLSIGNHLSILPRPAKYNGRSVRRIISSEDVGVVLLGYLKVISLVYLLSQYLQGSCILQWLY
jgi:hypothetical protein